MYPPALFSLPNYVPPKFVYPKWNGTIILSNTAKTMLIIPIIAELLNVSQ